MTTTLAELMALQSDLMQKMGVGLDGDRLQAEILDATLGMVEEAAEVVRESRHGMIVWRASLQNDAALQHQFEESVDIMFYLMEFWLLTGRSAEDVITEYSQKRQRNIERIASATR